MHSTAAKNLPTKEICEAYRREPSTAKLAKKYGCTQTSIRNHLKKGEVWPSYMDVQEMRKDKKSPRKNLQRDIINYITTSKEKVFTIEHISQIFKVSTGSACQALSSIAKKQLGLYRSIRGTYKRTNDVPTIEAQEHQQELNFEPEHKTTKSFSDICDKIVALAKECGGFDRLISRAEFLKQEVEI